MLQGGFFTKRSKITTLLVTLGLIMTMLAMPALALNTNGDGNSTGNKALNYCGYQYVDSNTIYVYLDKGTPSSGNNPVKEQFKITKVSDSSNVPISTLTRGSGSGIGDSGLTQGTRITLDTTNNFDSDALYEVTIGNTLYSNNGSNIGSYYTKHDVEFEFKSAATPTGDITVTRRPMNINGGVPWEGNIGFTIDRPVASTTDADDILAGMALQKWDGSDWADVIMDDTIDGTEEPGAECYTPHYNTARTYFFYPLTANTDDNVCYNLSSGQYRLTVPSFTIGAQTYNGATFEFTTTTGDVPGKLTTAPTVATGSQAGYLDVSWSAGTTDPIASNYNVYYSTDKYWNFVKANSSVVSSTSYTITGLTPSQLYYVRITPVNSYGEGGFSLAGQGTPN